jgi:predicted enzyme related to lactoylglutathione lyase
MNPVVHFEMPYENAERLSNFYSRVFGWQMMNTGEQMGHYILAGTTETDENQMVKTPGTINGGFFPRNDAQQPPIPNLVIQVDDVKDAMSKVKSAGGSIIHDPMEIPGVGHYVSFTDTEGNRVCMLQPLSR